MTNRKSILFCICIAISLLLPQRSMAQQYGFHKHKRTAAEQAIEDSIPLFRGVAVGVDLVGPVMRAVSDYGQYEGFARVNLKDRYFPTVEVGYGSADKTDDVTGLRYKTSAPFGRVGMDFNVMKNKHDAYRILVGFRYAYTSFNYDIGPLVLQDPVWGGSSTYEAKDQKCSYGWLEFGAASMPSCGSSSASAGRYAIRHAYIRKLPTRESPGIYLVTARAARRGWVSSSTWHSSYRPWESKRKIATQPKHKKFISL